MALEFDLNRDAPAAAATDCVVVGAFADNSLTPAGAGPGRRQRRPPRRAARARRRQRQDRQDRAAARPAGRHRAARAGGRPGRRRPSSACRSTSRPSAMPRARCKTGPVAHALFTLSEAAGERPRRRLDDPPGRDRRRPRLLPLHRHAGARPRRRTSPACARCRSPATTTSRARAAARRSPPACSSRASSATCRRTSATRPTSPSRRRSSPPHSTTSSAKCSTRRRWKSSAWARCSRCARLGQPAAS